MDLNAHEKPPDALRLLFKQYQKARPHELAEDVSVVDFSAARPEALARFRPIDQLLSNHAAADAFAEYLDGDDHAVPQLDQTDANGAYVAAYESRDLPGLIVLPALVPTDVQREMLHRSLHRDLALPQHLTNVHFHHHLEYPFHGRSFFDYDAAASDRVTPKDPETHKPMTVQQFFNKRLRWMTLGGQYDWTVKKYPSQPPPEFPRDLQTLLHRVFPSTQPEAAIVNLYSPGDVLSLHRDVSEYCDNGLISVSIGCDAIFLISPGLDQPPGSAQQPLALRLKSGDAVYMTGQSRYAWHGVPQIVRGTCPSSLCSWPAPADPGAADTNTRYEQWRDWMSTKRININVRQMFGQADTAG